MWIAVFQDTYITRLLKAETMSLQAFRETVDSTPWQLQDANAEFILNTLKAIVLYLGDPEFKRGLDRYMSGLLNIHEARTMFGDTSKLDRFISDCRKDYDGQNEAVTANFRVQALEILHGKGATTRSIADKYTRYLNGTGQYKVLRFQNSSGPTDEPIQPV